MKITLQELEQHRVEVHQNYAPGVLDYRTEDFKQQAPLQVDAVAELLGSEIRVRGHLETRLTACCDRCLGPVEFPLRHDFDLFYQPVENIAREEEKEIPDDQSEVGFYSAEGIDVAEVATEQVILAVPMKIVCQAGCLGLCPVCGADRNKKPCQCADLHSESPFASLREKLQGEAEGGQT